MGWMGVERLGFGWGKVGAYIVQDLADVGERLVAVDAVVFVVEVVLGFGEDVLVDFVVGEEG